MLCPVIGTVPNKSSPEYKANSQKMGELVGELKSVVSTVVQGLEPTEPIAIVSWTSRYRS